MTLEDWVQLYEFPDYMISTKGRIKNLHTKRILTTSLNGKGVVKVVLTKDKITYTRSVAKLVATTFHGEPPPGNAVVFLDGNYANCDVDNLEWRPRWFAQKRALQAKRTEPLRRGRIRHELSGVVYENSLECAKATNGIEDYIVLCAGDPLNRRYNGSAYRWVKN